MAEARVARWLVRRPLLAGAGLTLAGLVLAGVLAETVAPYSPTTVDATHMFGRPGGGHLFGTDRFGRDVL